MTCDRCGTPIEAEQRFCTHCGAEIVAASEVQPEPDASAKVYDLAEDEPELLVPRLPEKRVVLTPIPPPADPRGAVPAAPGIGRPQIGVVVVLGILTGVTGLLALVPRSIAIRTTSSNPSFATGDWFLADLGTNLPGALIIALITLAIGVVGAGWRQRWAYGLAGGSGLAITGWAALTVGLAERPVQLALDAVARPSVETFTVTITRDLGYVLTVAAGIGGLIVFLATLPRAGGDRRHSLNPWIAALGALAAVVAAVGPMIPEGAASLSGNWSSPSTTVNLPAALFIGRFVQLGLLAYTGVVGFLLVRRYGLGLAIGGMTVTIWLAGSTLLELGTNPVGPGFTNPGSDLRAVDLHAVTLAGTAALILCAILAVIAAYDLAAREHGTGVVNTVTER